MRVLQFLVALAFVNAVNGRADDESLEYVPPPGDLSKLAPEVVMENFRTNLERAFLRLERAKVRFSSETFHRWNSGVSPLILKKGSKAIFHELTSLGKVALAPGAALTVESVVDRTNPKDDFFWALSFSDGKSHYHVRTHHDVSLVGKSDAGTDIRTTVKCELSHASVQAILEEPKDTDRDFQFVDCKPKLSMVVVPADTEIVK